MQRAGISTALIGIIHLRGEQGPVKPLIEPWWDHLRSAIRKATEYDDDIGLFNSPGWSQSGGPWLPLDKSMRNLDSSEFQLVGPRMLSMTLGNPDGCFQAVRTIAFKAARLDRSCELKPHRHD